MAYSPAAQTWVSWNEQIYTQTAVTTGATTQQVWNSWNTQFTVTQVTYPPMPQPTPLEIAAAEERIKKYTTEREAAQKRAEEFLLEHLSPAQRETYEKSGLFIVESQKKNRFQLSKLLPPTKLEGDRHAVSYCIHTHGIPKEDELLGFKLLLEANEDEFLRTANATRLAA